MSSKLSSPSEEPDSKILKGYCGTREFVTPAHFTLRLKAHAKERRCWGHATKVQMA